MIGDHDCYCDSGKKVAQWEGPIDLITLDPIFTTSLPILNGRRKLAIAGESAYCEGLHSCMYEEDVDLSIVGGMSTYYHCRDLETDETYEVTSYFPDHGDSMSGSLDSCSDYSFHCEGNF